RRDQADGPVDRLGEHLHFFFQAEDGIRDKLVTGVQTCALPIYGVIHGCYNRSGGGLRVIDSATTNCKSVEQPIDWGVQGPLGPRSEERRVGKECRARWPPRD